MHADRALSAASLHTGDRLREMLIGFAATRLLSAHTPFTRRWWWFCLARMLNARSAAVVAVMERARGIDREAGR